jgi:hypothetical protein
MLGIFYPNERLKQYFSNKYKTIQLEHFFGNVGPYSKAAKVGRAKQRNRITCEITKAK